MQRITKLFSAKSIGTAVVFSSIPIGLATAEVDSTRKLQTDLLHLWFKDIRDKNYSKESISKSMGFWWGFGKTAEEKKQFDHDVTVRYKSHIKNALAGKYNSLKETAQGTLALCVLCDQLTRHVFRGTAQAFDLDPFIVQAVKEGIDKNYHKDIQPIERSFFFLPLMHSESLEDHQLSKKVLTEMVDELIQSQVPEHLVNNAKMNLKFLLDHTKLIERFGRYPHRNKVLGRKNTKQEEEYINSPEFESFGQ